MESTLSHPVRLGSSLPKVELRALSAWTLCGALLLYLGLDGGGYALATHSQVGIVVWWIVVVFSAWGLLPAGRLSRVGLAALTLLTAFVAWTALAVTWSISSGRSLQDLSLVVCYLGIFVLGVSIHRERSQAVRHTAGAVGAAVVVIAALAVASRIWPNAFPAAQTTGQFLNGIRARLSWPLNYWNALAALMDFGLPLLLALATSARTLRAQAASAAAIPLVALCGALTLSRGGLIAGGVVVVVFFLLAPERLPKLATAVSTGLGSAVLIAGAFRRHDFQKDVINATEHHQAITLLIAIIVVCGAVGAVQVGIGLAARHGTPHRLLRLSVARARWLSAAALVVLVAAGIGAGVPTKLHHVWRDFKDPQTTISQNSISRFGTASGEGRYQYWQAAVHATKGHVLDGNGPGTYQLLWLPRAPFQSYVTNAHSLYVETLSEEGIVGVALLGAFFVLILGAGVRLVARTRYEERTRAAGLVAALAGFIVFAAFDWIWQVAVLPAAFMLVAAALVGGTESRKSSAERLTGARALAARTTAVALGVASLAAIGFPLATSNALGQSQTAATDGNTAAAIADAQQAVQIEPSSGAAHLQLALTLELAKDYGSAVTQARVAVTDEPQNWSNWLTLSRLEAEAGHARDSVLAYNEARALNPRSSLFRNG
jgi:hypothetical protein